MVLHGVFRQRIGQVLVDRRGISAIEYALLGSVSAVFILALASSIAATIERILALGLN